MDHTAVHCASEYHSVCEVRQKASHSKEGRAASCLQTLTQHRNRQTDGGREGDRAMMKDLRE